MSGLLNVYKPRGITSYDVIRRLRRCLRPKTKLGHAGTLDPLAEGVLVVCVGAASRLAGLIQAREKEYLFVAELGAVSSTDDAEGKIEPTPGASPPPPGAVAEAVGQFVGRIEQVPPAYSAVKVGGRRAYKLARAGRKPDLKPRPVTVHALEVLSYAYPRLRLRVECGRGTYVRSLVRDIGRRLGVGGYCLELVRTRVGCFHAEQAVKIDSLAPGAIEALLIPPVQAVPAKARVPIDEAQARALAGGRAVPAPVSVGQAGGPVPAESAGGQELLGAVDPRGELVALVRHEAGGNVLRPVRVFPGRD